MTAPSRALVLIDMQGEYADGPLAVQYPPLDVTVANALLALDTAEAQGIPVVVVQHEYPEGSPIFARGSRGWDLHPDLAARERPDWIRSTKQVANVLDDPSLRDWVREQGVDTLTLVGYMTNNCVLATAAAAEPLGLAVEVLADATAAIHLANSAGMASAARVHSTLMVLLNSNFAAVATTQEWTDAAAAGTPLPSPSLGGSAAAGCAAFA